MATVMRAVEAVAAVLAVVYLAANVAAMVLRWRSRRNLLPVMVAVILLGVPSGSQAAGRVFFDDSEAGNTNLWNQDASRPKCTSVTTAADGLQGPFAGSWMIRCLDNGSSGVWETLASPSFSMTNEVLYRYRVRADSNHDSTSGSTHKIGRVFYFTGDTATYVDVFGMFATVGSGNGMYNDMILDGNRQGGSLYWGDASGDDTANPANWHTIMYYMNKATGVGKVWHDGILVRNHSSEPNINGEVGETGDFYITSNWEDAHDATNYVYFDNVEIFTDAGTGGVGLMSDGTMTQGEEGGGGGSPIVLILEWVPFVVGLGWHFRNVIMTAGLAVVGWTGTTVILAHEEAKQLTYQASVQTVHTVTTLIEKVKR